MKTGKREKKSGGNGYPVIFKEIEKQEKGGTGSKNGVNDESEIKNNNGGVGKKPKG